jgi:membrane protein YqaA with SNARE-associated domain
MLPMKAKKHARKIVQSPVFRRTMQIIGIFFIILTYFIAISPAAFLKLGYIGLFLFNIIGSGLVIIPLLAQKMNIIGIVLACALGNAINTSINYLVGNTSSSMFSHNSIVTKLKTLLHKFGLWMVYVFAIIPFPLDINGLLSGYISIPYPKYITVNFLGKITIFLIVAWGGLTVAKVFK